MLAIYKNILACIEHQGCKAPPALSDSDVFDEFKRREYLEIPYVTARGKSARFYLVPAESKYVISTPAFEKLLKFIPLTLDEVFIVTEPLSTHITKKVDAFVIQNPSLYFMILTPRYFVFNIPTHAAYIKHEVVSKDDVKDVCWSMYSDVNKFQKINHTDVMAIWCGARPGDLVRIYRPSETAGVSIVYRYCNT